MSETEKNVQRYYGVTGIVAAIRTALARDGKTLDDVTVDDLAAVDAFHTRGRRATAELAALVDPRPAHVVLDVGCGLGGTARYLTETYGCSVAGIDITGMYIETARKLTELTGMSDRIRFVQGNALELPFDDESFDIVWTEHAQMNIHDKERFYGEIARVLKPGRWFLFHDVFAGVGKPVLPVPWADNAAISALVSSDEARRIMQRSGLRVQSMTSKLTESRDDFRQVVERIHQTGLPPLGIHLLMGENAEIKIANYLRNLQTGRVSVAMGMAEKD